MLCSELQLVKHADAYTDIKLLTCNRWTCEICAPKRRLRLVALAASGEPTAFLTLTVNPAVGASALNRRNLLHDAWKRLVKRILRQFALDAEKRWPLKHKSRAVKQQRIVNSITRKTARLEVTKIHYIAFLERTAQGEPHLHILLRAPYIPQDWLSEQMREMLGAPIVDIRQVKSTRAAVFYVTKYVTKAPAQFGTTKRYWVSRDYEVNKGDREQKTQWTRGEVSIRPIRYEDWHWEIQLRGDIVKLLPDGWLRVFPRGTAWEQWGDFREPADA